MTHSNEFAHLTLSGTLKCLCATLSEQEKHPDSIVRYESSGEMTYDRIIAQSRNPIFYTKMGVPDDLTGRYNMIVIHLTILFTSIAGHEGAEARELRQHIFVKFIREMEAMVRDLGMEDEHVQREIRNIVDLCSRQITAYKNTINSGGQQALAREILENFESTHENTELDADTLAEYMMDSIARLKAQPFDAIMQGQLEFAL